MPETPRRRGRRRRRLPTPVEARSAPEGPGLPVEAGDRLQRPPCAA